MAKFQQNQKISNQERLLIWNVECWNWTNDFSLLHESLMCNFTLPDIFYMQWHHLKTQFYNDVRIFQISLVDSRRTRSAVCSCRARCPSRAISEHCSSWTVRCSRAAATSWESKTNANRYCGYLLLLFQRFFQSTCVQFNPQKILFNFGMRPNCCPEGEEIPFSMQITHQTQEKHSQAVILHHPHTTTTKLETWLKEPHHHLWRKSHRMESGDRS